MGRHPFDPAFEELPDSLPIFPLLGVLLLPGGKLPLNIFESRYLAMVRDVLQGPRLIGLVQPSDESDAGTDKAAGDKGRGATFGTGCAGRITAFSETDDGRYLITLTGLLRFGIPECLDDCHGYRRVRPDWAPYRCDLEEPAGEVIDRPRLLSAVRDYFASEGLEGDWEAIERTPDERLVTSLAMICPFEPREKQALLEAMTLRDRSDTMVTIMEMASAAPESGPAN